MGLAIFRSHPHPYASLAHVKHGKNAQNQQGATQIDNVLARGSRHLENTGLNLREVLEFKSQRRWVDLRIAEREHRLRHETLRLCALRQRRQACALAGELCHLKQRTVEDADQHLAGACALGLGHVGLHKIGHRLQPTRGLAINQAMARKQCQCTRRGLLQLHSQFGTRGVDGLRYIAAHGFVTRLRVGQRGFHAHETVHAALVVGGYPQVAKGFGGRLTHSQQKHGHAVARVDGQHVVVKLARLAGLIAQLVAHARAHIAQFLFGDCLVGRAKARLHRVAQVHLADIHPAGCRTRVTKILNVDGAQRGELQRQGLTARSTAFVGELRGVAHHTFHIKTLRTGHHGDGMQLQQRATVIEARLVDLDALVARGVVHLHACRHFFARGLVVDDDLAGEQLGHASGVVLHDEFLELDGKGQILQQHAIGLTQNGRTRLGAFGHQQVATEGRVALRQAVFGLHVGNQATALIGRLAAEQHLGAHDEITI
ncbi:hypothetical protein D3C71_1264580 [compost metagenome]